jgi:hypothetical protein
MFTTRMMLQVCPNCGKMLDSASHVQERISPKPGDLRVCIACTAILVFEPGMLVRSATNTDLRDLPPKALFELVRTQSAIREMRRQTQHKNN